MRVESDIITSTAASLIEQAVTLVIYKQCMHTVRKYKIYLNDL